MGVSDRSGAWLRRDDCALPGPGDTGVLLGAYLLVALAVLAGVPIFAGLTLLALIGLMALGFDPIVIPLEYFRLASTPALTAIPLFTFAGVLLSRGRTARRLLAVGGALLGWVPGGVAVMALAVCAVFTAFTGASGITIVALGGLLLPALVRSGFSKRFSLGLVTTSGSVGLLFPPSLPVILFAITAGVAVERLFLAGLLPGLLIVMLLGGYAAVVARGAPRRPPPFSGRRLLRAVGLAAWELPLPVAVVAAIYTGLVTIPEAATLTAVYATVLVFLVRREEPLAQGMVAAVQASMILVGGILIVLGAALAVTTLVVDQQVPQVLLQALSPVLGSRTGFLLALNLLLLVAGTMMDVFSAIVVLVPILLPLALEFGVDPVHLGVIVLANLEIGYLTPPVGLNLFISRLRFDVPLTQLYRSVLPFILLLLAALAVITFVPALALLPTGD